MSDRITIALLIVAMTFASPAVTASRGSGGKNAHAFEFAQYCMPEDEMPDQQTKIYC
jgi:hypothetical protein